VGLAGPASLTALLRYAKRCGVSASLRGLMSGAATGLIGQVASFAGPDPIIEALVAAGDLGIAPHYFSFGGAVETARYACEAAEGRIAAGRAMAQSTS
jgi:methylenetetrahydrofolate reductase (NADPH)